MKDHYDELCKCVSVENSVFSYLDSENIRELCNFFEFKTIPGGELLWHEGDSCEGVAFITSGRVEIKKETDFKDKHVVVGVLSKGAIVGALCILDNSRRAATAVALEDVTLAIITRENFNKLTEKHPELGSRLMKGMLLSISIRLRKSFERLSKFF